MGIIQRVCSTKFKENFWGHVLVAGNTKKRTFSILWWFILQGYKASAHVYHLLNPVKEDAAKERVK